MAHRANSNLVLESGFDLLRFCVELVEVLLLSFKLFDAVGDQFFHPEKFRYFVEIKEENLLDELSVEHVASFDDVFFGLGKSLVEQNWAEDFVALGIFWSAV